MPRTIAIGDIHGCTIALNRLIDVVAPTATDTVVTLGDYVNKGPDSKGVISYLLTLRSRCRLIPILGNHDVMMLGAVERRFGMEGWRAMGSEATLQSYGDTESIPSSHIEFLRSCRNCYETDTHFFVHANYEPDTPLDQQDEVTLLVLKLADGFIPGPHRSGKTAVVGHTSQKSGEILDLGHLKCIDTNCWAGGWLTALDVESGHVWQVNRDGQVRS